jgi:hypothetical protein
MAYFGSGAAAAAAAQRRRLQLQQEEEEETMTTYDPDELAGDWEFKIVRASMPVFARPETFRRLLEEESRAGWILVEKFDNSRVRFKRRRGDRRNDAVRADNIDPYRTEFRAGFVVSANVLGIIVIIVAALAMLLFYF